MSTNIRRVGIMADFKPHRLEQTESNAPALQSLQERHLDLANKIAEASNDPAQLREVLAAIALS